jgi:hypothetical protein
MFNDRSSFAISNLQFQTSLARKMLAAFPFQDRSKQEHNTGCSIATIHKSRAQKPAGRRRYEFGASHSF